MGLAPCEEPTETATMSGFSNEVLFLRGGNNLESNNCDDTLLLKDYEKHWGSVKKKVLRRMGYSGAEIGEVLKLGTKQKKKSQLQEQDPKWSEGAHCRSVFSEDGNTYEATVMEIYPDMQTCRVRYIGYGNEEDVALAGLAPSQGDKVREVQAQVAASNAAGSGNNSEEEPVQVSAPEQKSGKSSRKNKQKRAQPNSSGTNTPQFPPLPSARMPRFGGMPAVMPSVVPPMPFNMMQHSSEQTEAFSAMLMSWYMSGYYTGYYEAVAARRHQPKK